MLPVTRRITDFTIVLDQAKAGTAIAYISQVSTMDRVGMNQRYSEKCVVVCLSNNSTCSNHDCKEMVNCL
jgi:hypothetical protein